MKSFKSVGVFAVLGLLMFSGTEAHSQRYFNGSGQAGSVDSDVQQDLEFLREEEKLARDVYLSLYQAWGIPIFSNIAGSESQHMSRVKYLLDLYGISDPVGGNPTGVFEEPELAELYGDLVEKGRLSEVGALVVGATIEDLDIQDISEMMQRTTDPRILRVYSSLMCGSRNHLRAFYGQLSAWGVDYEAQFITGEQLHEIVNSARERCGQR